MDDITPDELHHVEPPAAPAAPLPFRRPADYYATPDSRLRPLFPRWVPLGCGWASLVFVIALFIAGGFAARSGSILDLLFGKIQDDLAQHFSPDVTPAQRATFAAEMQTMRASARKGSLKLDRTQNFLRLATDLDSDEKVNHAEVDKLIAAAHDVNRSVK